MLCPPTPYFAARARDGQGKRMVGPGGQGRDIGLRRRGGAHVPEPVEIGPPLVGGEAAPKELRAHLAVQPDQPSQEFEFSKGFDSARLARLRQGQNSIELRYASGGPLLEIIDSRGRFKLPLRETFNLAEISVSEIGFFEIGPVNMGVAEMSTS